MHSTRWIAHACLGLGLAAFMAAPAMAADTMRPDKVAFYFAAHEDDWQLFMNPSAFDDVISGARKTVFVHVTAGDAGFGMGSDGRKFPFYRARENGAETAIRFMADADNSPAVTHKQHVVLNGHSIYRVAYRNTVSYFLRVPDGNPQGGGYYETGYQSLKNLASGDNNLLAAIDGSTVYSGWKDFVATLHAIVSHERGNAQLIQINAAELDAHINPNDHSDHLMTAKAAFAAVQGMSCVRLVSYVDYASMNLPPNLNAEQRDLESSVFAVTLAGILAFDHRVSWHHYDGHFVGRNYFRVVQQAAGCGGEATAMAAARH